MASIEEHETETPEVRHFEVATFNAMRDAWVDGYRAAVRDFIDDLTEDAALEEWERRLDHRPAA